MKIFLYLSVIALATVASCSSGPKNETDHPVTATASSRTEATLTDAQLKSADIRTGKIEMREVSGVIKVNGVLDVPPQNLVSVSPPLGGFVKGTDLLQGMKVKKGDVLVTLEGPDYIQLQEDYLSGKSQLEFMSLEYQRQQELAKENVNATKTLQFARSNYLSQKARTEGLAAKLLLLHIDPAALEKGSIQNSIALTSPISGFITQVNINLGMHVAPTDVMFRIIDTDHLHAEAQVFEKDIALLRVGQKVRITLTNDPRERIASVYLIGKEVTADRTIRVHCHFNDEDPSLIPGMFFSGTIDVQNRPVPALPSPAVVTYEGKHFVFVESDKNRFKMREVTTGAEESGWTEILSPDSIRNTSVVVSGAYTILSQLKNSEK